ncbi:hypothetical protein FAF44_03015 [Nonomuraea sp. MG754425]|uniref:hypothetical protein n=1 Tax=Nonomuraea sp. MG754425 TaxID=2570319 RepID=UPI001F34F018|nr:hypothetical protein [Nonomuraea sp. MG754425]MCF6467386.1 hypothetical protein [Nonomuraea sp. MG754425]
MSQETRPKGRRRVLAAAAVLAIVVGGGYVAVSPATADLCDEEAVFFCSENPDSEGALLDLTPEEEDDTPEPIEEDQPADELVNDDEVLLPEEESAPEETDSAPALEAHYTEADLQMFKQGYDGAHARLVKSDNKCRNLISQGLKVTFDKGNIKVGPELEAAKPGQPDPRKVLSAVFDKGNIKLVPLHESPLVEGTSKTAPAVSKFSGTGGWITLFKKYFGEQPAGHHTYLMSEKERLSDPEERVLIMLHELAHLMGTIPGAEDTKYNIENLVYPFNARIVRDCVQNV